MRWTTSRLIPRIPGARDPKVLISDREAAKRPRGVPPSTDQAWGWVSWFSLVLAVVGTGDWILAWIPLRLGSPEWEFGTIASSFSGLPLVTMGFAGLLGSAVARGIRWQVMVMGVVLLVWLVWVLGALALFLLDVPIALQAVEGVARLGIIKAIVKTMLLGVVFSVAFLVAGIGALRHSRTRKAR